MKPEFNLTRRSLLTAAGVGGLGLALASCAGPGSGTTSPTTAASSGAAATLDPSKANGAISFAHWRGEDKAVFDEIIEMFTQKYAGTSVRQDITPSNDYQSNALQQIRQGNVGDLFTAFRGAQFNDMASAGLFVDLGATTVADAYEASLIEGGAHEGKQLGLPYQLVFNMPIINEDAMNSAGVTELPEDWDGFLDLCDKLKTSGLVPMAWPGGEMGNAGQLFNSMIMNVAPSDDMCTRIEKGELKVTEDWFIGMLRNYQELIPFMQPNATGTAVEPAQQMFASGQAAMLATGSYHMAAVRALGAQFKMNLLAPINVAKADAKYQGIHNATFVLGVSSFGENQDTAFALMEMLSDPEVAGIYGSKTAQHVTVKGVDYDNEDLKNTSGWLDKKTLLAPRFQFNNLDIRNAAEGACIAVVGGKSPEEAAAEAQAIIDQRVAK